MFLNFEHKFPAKRPRQTAQMRSDQGLPLCHSDKHFVNSSPDNQHFICKQEEEKCSVRILDLTYNFTYKKFTYLGL